eukprot:7890209-Alexandrium_andersonii.AAC.1
MRPDVASPVVGPRRSRLGLDVAVLCEVPYPPVLVMLAGPCELEDPRSLGVVPVSEVVCTPQDGP